MSVGFTYQALDRSLQKHKGQSSYEDWPLREHETRSCRLDLGRFPIPDSQTSKTCTKQ